MLILTRRVSEILMIGDDIQVAVMGIKGAQVRLGVQAPRTVQVDREEIYARKHPGYKPQDWGEREPQTQE